VKPDPLEPVRGRALRAPVGGTDPHVPGRLRAGGSRSTSATPRVTTSTPACVSWPRAPKRRLVKMGPSTVPKLPLGQWHDEINGELRAPATWGSTPAAHRRVWGFTRTMAANVRACCTFRANRCRKQEIPERLAILGGQRIDDAVGARSLGRRASHIWVRGSAAALRGRATYGDDRRRLNERERREIGQRRAVRAAPRRACAPPGGRRG